MKRQQNRKQNLNKQRQQVYDNMNRNCGEFPLGYENSKRFGMLSGTFKKKGGCSLYSEDITSNLAYDKYLGVVAYGTSAGHLRIISLAGHEYEKLNIFSDAAPITHLQFVPGELLLVAADGQNRLTVWYLGDRAGLNGERAELFEQSQSIRLS